MIVKKLEKKINMKKKKETDLVVLQISSKTEFIWGTLRDFAYYQNMRPFLSKNFTVTTDGCNKQTTKPG